MGKTNVKDWGKRSQKSKMVLIELLHRGLVVSHFEGTSARKSQLLGCGVTHENGGRTPVGVLLFKGRALALDVLKKNGI